MITASWYVSECKCARPSCRKWISINPYTWLATIVRMQNERNIWNRFCCSLLTSQIRIRVGEYDFSSVQERLPYVERGVAKKVVHPKYNFFTYEYDLALVRLESSLTFAPHISPICLPATDDLLIGENATVTGWGRLSEGGTLPSVLQEVKFATLRSNYKSTKNDSFKFFKSI